VNKNEQKMNGDNDCCLINVRYVCKTFFSNFKQLFMKPSIQTIQKKFNSTKQDYYPDHLSLTPSRIEFKSNEAGVSCKEVSFVVEWQMHNPQPEYSEEK
jgi:hypothetical protein